MYNYDLVGNSLSREITAGGQSLTTTYSYDPNTDRLLTEAHDGPELAFYWHDQPVYAYAGNGHINHYRIFGQSDDIGQLKAFFIGMPSQWSQYLFRLMMLLMPLLFFMPILGRLIRRKSSGRSRLLSLCHRSLCILLAYLMLISQTGLEQLAKADIQYSQLSTTDWASGNRTIEYTYDSNGSVEIKTTKVTTTQAVKEIVTYEYNLQNRLAKVTTIDYQASTTTVVAYKYNVDGVRIAKIEDQDGTPVTTTYLIDSYDHTGYAQVLEETIDDGTVERITYTIGDDIITQSSTEAGVNHLLYDGHGSTGLTTGGSTRQLVNSSANVTDCYSYDAYGVMLGGNPTAANTAIDERPDE